MNVTTSTEQISNLYDRVIISTIERLVLESPNDPPSCKEASLFWYWAVIVVLSMLLVGTASIAYMYAKRSLDAKVVNSLNDDNGILFSNLDE